MTKKNTRKMMARARQAKTGERYTTARSHTPSSSGSSKPAPWEAFIEDETYELDQMTEGQLAEWLTENMSESDFDDGEADGGDE